MFQKKLKKFLLIFKLGLIALIWLCGQTNAEESSLISDEQKELLEVKVHRIIVDPENKQPVISLSDLHEERALLIWIDFFEARAIYSEIQGIKHIRPLTHDLLASIIQKVNGKIDHIVITHFKENIYYAKIVLKRDDSVVEVDARPSDSIVMALKFKAPIFVSQIVFQKMAIPLKEQKGIEEEYGLIIQDLTPSLAKYLSFGSNRGVLVSDVRKESRAAKDGIKTGDIFVEIGEMEMDDVMSMKDALATSKTSIEAKIFRKSSYLYITLHLK
jgi:bifunctional DNase/RNase